MTAMSRNGRAKRLPRQRVKESLPGRERFILAMGLSLAVLVMLFFGLLMFSLQNIPAAPDPDAESPVIQPDYPRQLVDFSLTDQSGHAFTRKNLDGKIVVVDFIFTSCAVVCPYVNAQMEKIQQSTAGDPEVRLISITMDPIDDTAPILAHYGRTFNEDESRWSFLTGYQSEIRRLVGISFLPPDTTGEFSYMPGNFAHTQRIALVDTKGRLVEYFDGLNQNAADAVAQEIAKLRNPQP
jgi:protein SCO1/2